MEINFTVWGEPFGKLNMRPRNIAGHASAFNPQKNVSYMQRVKDELFSALGEVEGPIGEVAFQVEIKAFFKIPKSTTKKKAAQMLEGKIKPTKKPDLDNISKVILDAVTMSGAVWRDDSQVAYETLQKEYSERPRVEVSIKELAQ